MRTFLKFWFAGFVAQFGALLLFIQVSKTPWASGGKFIVITTFGVIMATILWKAVSTFQFSKVVLLCIALAVGGAAALQSIGFLRYPGLVKDLDLKSAENVALILAQTSKIFVLFLAISILLLFLRGGAKISTQVTAE